MFEEIFFPRTAEKYRAAPLVEQRERYLVHLRETGARRTTLRKCANDQVRLVRLLNLKEGGKVHLSQIEAVTALWSQPKARRCDRSASRKARTGFLNHAVRWLRFLGWLDEAEREQHPHHAKVQSLRCGCARSEAFPRRPYKTTAAPPTTSSSGCREEGRRWMQFRWPRSMILLQQSIGGEPGVGGQYMITRND